jgi:hypothetical protein
MVVALFDSKPVDPLRQGRLAICLQAASLFFTGFLIWNLTAAAQAQWLHLPLRWVLILAALIAVAAWAFSAAITLTLYALVMHWERAEMIKATLRTSAVAIWFAPAVILLSQLSPAALAGALVLVIYTTRLLYAQWQVARPTVEEPAAAAPVQTLFGASELPNPAMVKELAPALTASFCVQTAAVATLFHYPLLAAFGYAMSAAVVTIFALASGAYRPERKPTLPRSILGVLATVLLAVGLTVGGLAPRLMRSFGWSDGPGIGTGNGVGNSPQHGLVETARAFLREILYRERPVQQNPANQNPSRENPGPPAPPPGLPGAPNGPHPGVETKNYTAPSDLPGNPAGVLPDGGFPGVILWPELKPVPTLIAPLPPQGKGWSTAANVRPMSIPFSGEYWMFRWPYARPPQSSYFQRGNPAELSFTTTDHRPMQMEAHHKLEQTVDLRCCSRIQLELRNADRYPGTVTVELVLLNSELSKPGAQSLGKALVVSRPDTSKDPVTPVAETLDFVMPAAPAIEAFDEFKVVFLRDRVRMDKSAKIAIDRFILVPR